MSGVLSASVFRSSPERWEFIAVSITPGATQLTLMPLGPTSCASALVSPMTAALVAEYSTSHDAPTCPHMEERLTMLPACIRSMCGNASRQQRNMPSTFTEKVFRHSS